MKEALKAENYGAMCSSSWDRCQRGPSVTRQSAAVLVEIKLAALFRWGETRLIYSWSNQLPGCGR
jgi:hypothetical protein